MSYELKRVQHNTKIRLCWFFVRPLNVLFIFLLGKLWKYLSYAPGAFDDYLYGLKAPRAVEILWREEFRPFVLYFIIAAVADLFYQEWLNAKGL